MKTNGFVIESNVAMPEGKCDGCGAVGYLVDTPAGEVVHRGEVVARAPFDSRLLLAGLENGTRTTESFCDDCARHLAAR